MSRIKTTKAASKWHCKACNKTSYGSAGRAEYALGLIHEIRGAKSDYLPRRAYPCPYGNGHHLTSQEEIR